MTVRESENSIRRQKYETAIAWNAQGNQILRKDGEQYQIIFSDAEIAHLHGAILTHNHPRGWEFPEAMLVLWVILFRRMICGWLARLAF